MPQSYNKSFSVKFCAFCAFLWLLLLFSAITAEYQKLWSPFCEIKDKKQPSVPVRTQVRQTL